jgi:hypothetical protein
MLAESDITSRLSPELDILLPRPRTKRQSSRSKLLDLAGGSGTLPLAVSPRKMVARAKDKPELSPKGSFRAIFIFLDF